MNEGNSLARVVRALEKKLTENPTPELCDRYVTLLGLLAAPVAPPVAAAPLSRLEDLEGRVVFLEQLQKVRIVSGGKIA